MSNTQVPTNMIMHLGVQDPGPIDETSPDLDPTDAPPVMRPLRTVRYGERFAGQVRELGGIEAEAALIAHLGGTS